MNRSKYNETNKNTELKIRYANIKDFNFTLKLYNQNFLRGNNFSKRKVLPKEHEIWFKDKIKDKMLFISSLSKKKIGYIRFDYVDKKNLSVSIAINDKFKRSGFGRKMLTETLNKNKISKFNVIAKIKKQNLTSKKFFLSLGFKFLEDDTYILKN